jgi:hypothetical protein
LKRERVVGPQLASHAGAARRVGSVNRKVTGIRFLGR